MNPSLSCKPNQRVERRGVPFLLFILVFVLLDSRCQEHARGHSTTPAASPILVAPASCRLSRRRLALAPIRLHSPSVRHIAKLCTTVPDACTRAQIRPE